MASYPNSVKSFTSKNNGDVIQAATDNDEQDEIAAIEQDLINGLPISRGGTGLKTIGAADTVPVSDGSALVYGTIESQSQNILAMQVFS